MLASAALCNVVMVHGNHATLRSIIWVEVVAFRQWILVGGIQDRFVGVWIEDIVTLHTSLLLIEESLSGDSFGSKNSVLIGGVLKLEPEPFSFCDVWCGQDRG